MNRGLLPPDDLVKLEPGETAVRTLYVANPEHGVQKLINRRCTLLCIIFSSCSSRQVFICHFEWKGRCFRPCINAYVREGYLDAFTLKTLLDPRKIFLVGNAYIDI